MLVRHLRALSEEKVGSIIARPCRIFVLRILCADRTLCFLCMLRASHE